MKKLLSLLLCFVFLQAETFALRGGPANSGTLTVNGYYSGIMTDITGQGNTGLFLIGASPSGASTGQFIIFSFSFASSNAYQGIITGLSDTSRGGTGTFTGIFSGQSVVQTSSTTQSLSGQMTCHAVHGLYNQTLRLSGTATSETLSIDNNNSSVVVVAVGFTNGVTGPVVNYTIDGWNTAAPSGSSTSLSLGGGS